MRRIVLRHTLIDERGFAWETQVTMPWPDREASHGPEGPLVTVETPNDPEHWAYGEPGPTFNVDYLDTLLALIRRVLG